MELKVWVEGIQRIVCGVTEATTCQDVVFALAHATGKVGRFTLIERWRNNERLLAPLENPLKILMKWGEYSNDVQFILQRSDQQQPRNDTQQQKTVQPQSQQQIIRQQQQKIELIQPKVDQNSSPVAMSPTGDVFRKNESFSPTERNRETRKSINISSHSDFKPENIGIVKGIQQKPSNAVSPQKQSSTPLHSPQSSVCTDPGYVTKTKSGEFNSADVRSSLDRKTNTFKEANLIRAANNVSNESILESFNNRNNSSDVYKNSPPISSNGALVPPPYRDPPPPRTSPLHQKSDSLVNNNKKFEFKENININNFLGNTNEITELNDTLLHNTAQYRDLIQLIKFQREKINLQQADLTKFDTEIVYLESKERDQMQQIEAITREINKTDHLFRQGNEQLQTLQYVEEENELVRQQEKTLKSEITLLRSKLANCETELLQCKNKIRILMDEIQIEQRALNRQYDSRQQLERNFLTEVERIQSEIDQIIHNADSSNKITDNLKKEVALIENAIAEKKKQVEQLVNEMKEVNLQSLAVAPSDEIRHLLEGSNRPGSTRRIIGSPRQLENAVPTSKNPHGVWV